MPGCGARARGSAWSWVALRSGRWWRGRPPPRCCWLYVAAGSLPTGERAPALAQRSRHPLRSHAAPLAHCFQLIVTTPFTNCGPEAMGLLWPTSATARPARPHWPGCSRYQRSKPAPPHASAATLSCPPIAPDRTQRLPVASSRQTARTGLPGSHGAGRHKGGAGLQAAAGAQGTLGCPAAPLGCRPASDRPLLAPAAALPVQDPRCSGCGPLPAAAGDPGPRAAAR